MAGTPFHKSYQLAEAIETAVSEAAASSRSIRPDMIAQDLLRQHPDCGLEIDDLTKAVAEAATQAQMGLTILAPEGMASA